MLRFDIITIFPDIIRSYIDESILKRAQKKKKVRIVVHDLREYTLDKHRTTDDRPYGGGAGMLLKVEPIYRCITKILRISQKKTLREFNRIKRERGIRVFLMSAKGRVFDQRKAHVLTKVKRIILICGRYEGVDERVLKFVDSEVSIGNYVLTGGELASLTIVDAVVRLLPGVLGTDESSMDESHSRQGYIEYPHYTRPEVVEIFGKRCRVPAVLLSGDHQKIKEWREKKSKWRSQNVE